MPKDISGISSSPVSKPKSEPVRKNVQKTPEQPVQPLPTKDCVELSGAKIKEDVTATGTSPQKMQDYVEKLKMMPDVNQAKVEEVQKKLENGLYGDEALKGTVDALLEELL